MYFRNQIAASMLPPEIYRISILFIINTCTVDWGGILVCYGKYTANIEPNERTSYVGRTLARHFQLLILAMADSTTKRTLKVFRF